MRLRIFLLTFCYLCNIFLLRGAQRNCFTPKLPFCYPVPLYIFGQCASAFLTLTYAHRFFIFAGTTQRSYAQVAVYPTYPLIYFGNAFAFFVCVILYNIVEVQYSNLIHSL